LPITDIQSSRRRYRFCVSYQDCRATAYLRR